MDPAVTSEGFPRFLLGLADAHGEFPAVGPGGAWCFLHYGCAGDFAYVGLIGLIGWFDWLVGWPLGMLGYHWVFGSGALGWVAGSPGPGPVAISLAIHSFQSPELLAAFDVVAFSHTKIKD